MLSAGPWSLGSVQQPILHAQQTGIHSPGLPTSQLGWSYQQPALEPCTGQAAQGAGSISEGTMPPAQLPHFLEPNWRDALVPCWPQLPRTLPHP